MRARDWHSALRVSHWLKNGLIFIPWILVARTSDAELPLAVGVLAFAGFSACASIAYLINDACDLDLDRRHPWKAHRPLASGRMSREDWAMALGVLFSFVLGMASLAASEGGVAVVLPGFFGIYLAASLLYSARLKRRAVWDVLGLGFMIGIRFVAGAALLGEPSIIAALGWLFLGIGLATLRRSAELFAYAERRESGRPYARVHAPVLLTVGVLTVITAVVGAGIALPPESFSIGLALTVAGLALALARMLWLWRAEGGNRDVLGRVWSDGPSWFAVGFALIARWTA